ncbi:MAG: SprT family zinc-dependent metalloprotease [bacterium]
MTKKILEIKDIGFVHFYKIKNAKNLRIILKPNRPPRITVPARVPFQTAEDFLHSKILWLKENFEKIKQLENKNTVFDENSEFKTREHTLNIKRHALDSFKYKIKDGLLEFYCPVGCDIKTSPVQKLIALAIIETLRLEAKNYLPEKVKELSQKYNLSYKKVFIKNLKSRWGSCSSKNNINLNLHLMRLPEKLIDYVILHELAHTKEKNHGKNFWSLLSSFVPEAKELNKELKNHSINL